MNTASPRHLRHRGTRNIDLCHDCALLLPTPLATRRCDDIELGWCSPRSRHSAVSAPVCDNRTESRLPPAHHTRRATPEAYPASLRALRLAIEHVKAEAAASVLVINVQNLT